MRLYLKLSFFAVAFCLIQACLDGRQSMISHAIFAVRCHFAWQSSDEEMIEQLVRQGQVQLRREQDAVDRHLASIGQQACHGS